MGFTITTDSNRKSTQISNIFITKYMPSANGNFVKVYLHLLMASQHPSIAEHLSISSLADEMECTENDIRRAIHYWQKEGLLSVQESNSEIQEIALREPEATDIITHEGSASVIAPNPTVSEPYPQKEEAPSAVQMEVAVTRPVPAKINYTPLQQEALSKDMEIDQTIKRVAQLLGTPVSQTHLQNILYFMCDIGFSSDLVITLYETAVNKGKKQPQYIEAIGIKWAEQGITTPEEAREEAAAFSGRYALVARSLGITRGFAPAEREIIDSWNPYQFADSIIAEACKRTVLQTGDTNLQYVSKILQDWHKNNVISLDDIKKCDESYKRQKQNKSEKKKTIPNKNQFQNFPQRAYSQSDYNSLERKLLQGTKS